MGNKMKPLTDWLCVLLFAMLIAGVTYSLCYDDIEHKELIIRDLLKECK